MKSLSRVTRVLAVALFGAPLISHAADILAGVAYGGPRQSAAVCYLFNGGSNAVNISSKSLLPEPPFGTSPFPFIYDTCGTSVAPGTVCAFVAQLTFNGGTACKVTVTPSGTNVRGSLEIRDPNNEILNSVDLR